ncbi:uncharacterized protein METZ01_LOCUS363563 [marine metagenome]|uniref:Uncharacterized protein n=1 Tax=marine metagenome TaxID=408172 RepID=A0A382SLE1_9ZZZZ
MTRLQHSTIMVGMARGTQYCTVTLNQLNQILRPNAKVVVSRKFAELLDIDSKTLELPAGQSNLILPSIVEDSLIPEHGVSLKVEDWTE